jgi:hypothetical protein
LLRGKPALQNMPYFIVNPRKFWPARKKRKGTMQTREIGAAMLQMERKTDFSWMSSGFGMN